MVALIFPPNPDISPNQSISPLTTRVNALGHLEIGGWDVVELANRFGTPLYLVDEKTIRRSCQLYRHAFAQYYPAPTQVLYATKAWNCKALCALMLQEGLGLDVASGGELYTALQVGATGKDLYFHGNAKTPAEHKIALESECTIVVDSLYELQQLVRLIEDHPARVMLRVNPGIDVHTHDYIRTGQIDSKFGIGSLYLEETLRYLQKHSQLHCVGLHAHIGSQIFDLKGHQELGEILVQIWQKALSYGLEPTELNVGGGLGIRYVASDDPPSITEWVKVVCAGVQEAFAKTNLPLPKLLCEPGRSLIGPSTVTAYHLGGRKQIPVSEALPQGRLYQTIDGGMSDNPRPITYQAVYTPLLANRPEALSVQQITIAGKHCESGDLLLKDVWLPEADPGDVLVVFATGAYNYSMASNYNRFPRPAALLLNEGQAHLMIRQETYEDLIRQDVLPAHLDLILESEKTLST